MFIHNLQVTNFKNLKEKKLEFQKNFIGITGLNGVGKTSILDAIHYLSLTKSYINSTDKYNINYDSDFFNIKGSFTQNDSDYLIQVVAKEGSKKEVKKNNKIYSRISDHIGLIKTVIISPYDRDLIWEGSEFRRKFLDHLISQTDPTYLEQLMRYNKVLNQRNRMLKFFRENNTFDQGVLDSYNEQMKTSGSYIYQKRKDISEEIIPIFQKIYKEIAQSDEDVDIRYQSDLDEEGWEKLFEQSLIQDRQSGYTQKGIHKDDLILLMHDHPVKKVASQGQQKTFVIAMKFAQTQILINHSGQKPILLLDDIFDKLDEKRVKDLVKLIEKKNYGQVLITDTDSERIEFIFKDLPDQSQTIAL